MVYHLTIARKLGLGFGLIVALLVLVTLVGINRVQSIDATLTEVNESASLKQRYAINFRGSVHDRAIAIRDAVLVMNEADRQRHLQDVADLAAYYDESREAMNQLIDAQGLAPRERALLEDIREIETRALSATEELYAVQEGGTSGAGHDQTMQAQAFLLDNVSGYYAEWLKRINAFIDYQEANIQEDISDVRSNAGNFGWLMVVVAGVAIVASIIVSVLIIRNLRRILGAEPETVAVALRRLAEGDLTPPQQPAGSGSVMAAVSDTAQRLIDIISEVRASAQSLSDASRELSSTSDENNRQIQLQSGETEQMATAINEMSASVKEVTDNAAQAATATQNADQDVEKGNSVVVSTTEAMKKLADTLESAAERVGSVSQKSSDIERIVEVINAIAEQTNLLALNAAIEAARAGDHGRGFAVVADEVRSLANRTQESTREIGTMISQLQESSTAASSVMETSRGLANDTVEQTIEAETALSSIRDQVASVTDMNTQIASAAEEQSRVAEEVNQNISRINDATSASSQGADQVATASRNLLELSEELTQKVSRFRWDR